MNKPECCGTCKYNKRDDISDDWVCICQESDYFSDFTEYTHTCGEWEAKGERSDS